ncbi:PCMD domain-containing protein [Myroides marinus]|uniref:Putative carbohydrate metabolism domain-containing protein n=1 Tax=Myroides marinus TaxID=703342 RepID=A0A1H6RZT3_9FLAO|nr:PCMD domain-containing protein [Myroides marinus]MDM1360192.1 PCMD domain-containing protein [Myroides marinus]MDM1500667.1 PCMD domain-containing protein [Myroides marinus]SEI61273.1 Putative carbohydrate metabolism domain-containing protein [Myroides marinus]
MRINYLFFTLLAIVGITFSSCIKDEALNAEADILKIIATDSIQRTSPKIENTNITVYVNTGTDLTKQAPEFIITDGATISPASKTELDFTDSQFYTVTSQDGKWSKKYKVTYSTAKLPTKYNFDNYEIRINSDDEEEKYFTFFDYDEAGIKTYPWTNANAAFYFSVGEDATPYDYPTTISKEGYDKSAIKLTTKSTGFFGNILKKPIAAGSSFIGQFDVQQALSNSLLAIHLGAPFDKVPTAITGKFKYESGSTFVEVINKRVIETPGKKIIDKFDLYAVFFENKTEGKNIYLDGTNKFDHPNIVSIARIDPSKAIETDSWIDFKIPFVNINGKSINIQKLKSDGYSLTIVMSSSVDGDFFKGALESTLLVDDLEIIYEKVK